MRGDKNTKNETILSNENKKKEKWEKKKKA
jgi:hypothetical protein